jgi:surface carbohydrate biosynthesis protein
MRTDILILELPNSDRDLNITIPLFLYLKNKGINVVIENLKFSYLNILKYRPKIVLFSSLHDSVVIEEKRKLHKAGIPIISLTCEGNFTEEFFSGYFWGYNREEYFYQELLLLWNQKSIDMTLKRHPELSDKIFLGGSIGHDRYFYKKFMPKEIFLKTHSLEKYKKVIGIAGCGMFKYIGIADDYFNQVNPDYPKDQFDIFEKDLIKLRVLYKELILRNIDVLFILRVHPELVNEIDKTEFSELINLPNVCFSHNNSILPKIEDSINISDIWIGYESNTTLEAWLIGKPVIYLNPTTSDFKRENHSNGVLIVNNIEKIQDLLFEFYATGSIQSYELKNNIRNKLINETIGFRDGLNHKRSGDIIFEKLHTLPKATALNYFKLLPLINWKWLLKSYLYNQNWYWKFRIKITKPEYLFYKGSYFGENHILYYQN